MENIQSQGTGFTSADFSKIGINPKLVDAAIDNYLHATGAKTAADIINYEAAAKAGYVDYSAVQAAKSVRRVDLKSKTHDFNQQGGLLIQNDTVQITKVIQEDYGQLSGGKTSMDSVFPDAMIPAQKVVVEVVAAAGGILDAYSYGSPVSEIAKVGNRMYEYEGQPYRNFMKMNEYDLTFLRMLGDPNTSARGVLQRITMYSLQAKVLMNNRKALLKNTIFANGFTSANGQVVSYQIPSYNQVASVTDPVNGWGTYNTTTGQTFINANSNPMLDLYFYLQVYQPWISRSEQLKKCRIVMNPRTQFFIVNNPNVKSMITAVQARPGAMNDPRGQRNAEFFIKTLIPMFEGTVEVDGYTILLQNSDVTWNPNGTGFNTNPVGQQFTFPDGVVFFDINTEEYGGPKGEFIYTNAVQNGGFVSATPGPWFIIEDCTAEGTRGGPSNPFIQLNFGFAGGLAPYRPESILFGNFVNITS